MANLSITGNHPIAATVARSASITTPSQEGWMNVSGKTFSVREMAGAFDDCFAYLKTIPQAIGKFFQYRYADVNLFVRAFKSMGGGTDYNEILRRIDAVTRFRDRVEPCLAPVSDGSGREVWNRQMVMNIPRNFQSLNNRVQYLFFNVDQDLVQRLANAGDSPEARDLRERILYECDQVKSFQRILTSVNTFYRVFTGSSSGSTPTPITRPRPPGPGPQPVPGAIPGTLAYDQYNIPQAVQDTANEITRLKAAFDNLPNPPAIPDEYNCLIMTDIMSIPVFDSSHPAIQNALNAADSTALNNRGFRHFMDKDSFETHMTTNHPTVCPQCRHPAPAGVRWHYNSIQRENMLIDTALQNEIRDFLNNAVNGPATSTATPVRA